MLFKDQLDRSKATCSFKVRVAMCNFSPFSGVFIYWKLSGLLTEFDLSDPNISEQNLLASCKMLYVHITSQYWLCWFNFPRCWLLYLVSYVTGIGLAHICNAMGFKCVIFMPNTQSQEKVDLMRVLGATVYPVPAVAYTDPDNYNHQVRPLQRNTLPWIGRVGLS